MKIPFRLLVASVLAAVLLAATFDAEAARLGGGKSFGSKPSYGGSYSQPIAPSSPSGPQQSFGQQGMNRQQTPSQPAPGGFFSRFGGMGGLLGGLLLGGLVGSLFGGGYGGGIGLMDILLIGGGLWLLFRFLGRRKEASGPRPQPAYGPDPRVEAEHETMRRTAETGWDALRSTPASGAPQADAGQPQPNIPAGFDQEEFLKGAKTVYTRLQESWDRRDLADIRTFTTPEVLAEIERQAKADPQPGRTEILLLNARLLEVRQEGTQTVATVYYDALLREDPRAQASNQVREVWHFRRDESVQGDNWRLEGIQQLEA